jgi:hypothetical protein
MKRLIFSLLILIPVVVYAALNETDRAFMIPRNLLKNPGFEQSKHFWIASGGSTTYQIAITAASVGTGNAAVRWLNVASTHTLMSTAVAIPTGYYGAAGLAGCYFKGGGASFKVQVWDGSQVLATSTVTGSSNYSNSFTDFTFPTSGNVQLRIQSASTTNPPVLIDDCYVGATVGISNPMSQTQYYFSGYHDTDCGFTTTSTSFATSDVDAGSCTFTTQVNNNFGTVGSAQGSGDDVAGITFTPNSAGAYIVKATIGLYTDANNAHVGARLWDGANALDSVEPLIAGGAGSVIPATLVGLYNATSASATTILIQMKTQGASSLTFRGVDNGIPVIYWTIFRL